MSAAREAILAGIRKAQVSAERGDDYSGDYKNIPRQYRRAGALNREQRLQLFEERLRDYEATVYRCAADGIAETVAKALAVRGKTRMVVPANVPRSWLPHGSPFVPGDELTYEQLDASAGVLTGCVAAIAVTGTIVLSHSRGQGGRAVTLIPDYHLCVVLSDQVVETVPEAIGSLDTAAPLTTISGPSATSDIEMTRVKGVHGPRVLDVILAGE